MQVNVKSLVGKVNLTARNALEGAAGLCLARTHYNIEIEHYLAKLIDCTNGDLRFIARSFQLNLPRFSTEIACSLERLKSGNARTPTFSPAVLTMLSGAWMVASIDRGADQIRSGFTILALARNEELWRLITAVSQEFGKILPDVLERDFATITSESCESSVDTNRGELSHESTSEPGRTPNLDRYTVNLTECARAGQLDPVLGRDREIRQVIDILMRRRQNNPILTGEAGVGKTAIVEGFASRVASGDVPPPLQNVSVRALDLALLQAGAGVKGEFETRLKGLMEEAKSSATPVILFIDEAHTMVGAGGTAGQNDAANLLKPALARGDLRTIAATTWSEYKTYFEKDAALARRFQVVKVEEPDEDRCKLMLRGIIPSLEEHHRVQILEEGVSAAVRLSHRYLAGRQLPDKAVSVLDTACARLALAQNGTPPSIEDVQRHLVNIETQRRILEREAATGSDHRERLTALTDEQKKDSARLTELQSRWEKERDLTLRIRELRARLGNRGGATSLAGNHENGGTVAAKVSVAEGETLSGLKAELRTLDSELASLQNGSPLVRVCVDEEIVSEVIAGWTGVPLGHMLADEMRTVLSLEGLLAKRVIGQPQALQIISRRIATSWAELRDPSRPAGVFLLVGPSGVGKTETALALSEILYGGERHLITINMSEFQEPHTVSTLKGSPPGYIGYGEGGLLTEAVRQRPYSVVLLDEFEKAHANVRRLFYQVFDKGALQDGEGREVDFRNTIIIMTTNACSGEILEGLRGGHSLPPEQMVEMLKPGLNRVFEPALLGRVVVVPYRALGDDEMRRVAALKIERIKERIKQTHHVELVCDNDLADEVARRCGEIESGARGVDNILTNTLLPGISAHLLELMVDGRKATSIQVSVNPGHAFAYS